MKKLRSKEKESEKLIKSQDKKIETQNQELDRLQKVLDNKCDVEKKHTGELITKQVSCGEKKYTLSGEVYS